MIRRYNIFNMRRIGVDRFWSVTNTGCRCDGYSFTAAGQWLIFAQAAIFALKALEILSTINVYKPLPPVQKWVSGVGVLTNFEQLYEA